ECRARLRRIAPDGGGHDTPARAGKAPGGLRPGVVRQVVRGHARAASGGNGRKSLRLLVRQRAADLSIAPPCRHPARPGRDVRAQRAGLRERQLVGADGEVADAGEFLGGVAAAQLRAHPGYGIKVDQKLDARVNQPEGDYSGGRHAEAFSPGTLWTTGPPHTMMTPPTAVAR